MGIATIYSQRSKDIGLCGGPGDGGNIHQLLTGPIGYFKIIDEAEIYAVEMAKTWIDAESADDLTP
jgi:hypothetical protein